MKRSEKLRLLAQALDYHAQHGFRGTIERFPLQRLIMENLNPLHDPHSVNGWVNFLLAKGFISHAYQRMESRKPTRATLYVIDRDKCGAFLNASSPK